MRGWMWRQLILQQRGYLLYRHMYIYSLCNAAVQTCYKFWGMVRSGERPDSAKTDWLASQNDSFTVALFTVFALTTPYDAHGVQY